MLNSKDISSGSGKISPIIKPGNQVLKINKITFDKAPYQIQGQDPYNITLHVESKPIGGGFKGFLVDPNNESGPRYEGQVGRVAMSAYPFIDKVLPSGVELFRDDQVLKNVVFLADTLGVREELNQITEPDVFSYMDAACKLFENTEYLNFCVGASEWLNKNTGYTNLNLWLPRLSRNGVPIERLDVENSNLIQFDRENKYHYSKLKEDKKNTSFEPKSEDVSDDFSIF